MLLLKRVIQHQPGGLEFPSFLSEAFGQFADSLLHPSVASRLGSQGTDEVGRPNAGRHATIAPPPPPTARPPAHLSLPLTPQVSAHKWLQTEELVGKWMRLRDGELVSPLKAQADDKLVQALAVGVDNNTWADEPQLPEGADLHWLAPFAASFEIQ